MAARVQFYYILILAPPGSEDPFAAISRILNNFSKIIIGNNSFDVVSYEAPKRVILAPEKTIMGQLVCN